MEETILISKLIPHDSPLRVIASKESERDIVCSFVVIPNIAIHVVDLSAYESDASAILRQINMIIAKKYQRLFLIGVDSLHKGPQSPSSQRMQGLAFEHQAGQPHFVYLYTRTFEEAIAAVNAIRNNRMKGPEVFLARNKASGAVIAMRDVIDTRSLTGISARFPTVHDVSQADPTELAGVPHVGPVKRAALEELFHGSML